MVVRFTLDNKEYLTELQRTIQTTQAELEKMKKGMQGIGKDGGSVFQSLISGGQQLAALFGVGLGLNAFKQQWEYAYRSFVQYDQAQRGLRTILQANQRDVQSSMRGYNEYAEAVANTTTNSKLATLGLLKLAEGYQLTGTAAKEAVREAQALGHFTGHDPQGLLRITTAMQKGDYSEAMAMSRQLPQLRHIKDEMELINSYGKLVSASAADQAEYAKTAAGRWEIIENKAKETAAGIGEGIVPALEASLNLLNQFDPSKLGLGSTGSLLKEWKIFQAVAFGSLPTGQSATDNPAYKTAEGKAADKAREAGQGLENLLKGVNAGINKAGLSELEQKFQIFARLGAIGYAKPKDVQSGLSGIQKKELADQIAQYRELFDLKNTLGDKDRLESIINPQKGDFGSFDPLKSKAGFLADIVDQTEKLSRQWEGVKLVNDQFEKMARVMNIPATNGMVQVARQFITHQMAMQEGFRIKMDVMTPEEKLEARLKELFDVLRLGGITWQQYGLEAEKARNQILGATAAITAAAAAGSNDARVRAFESLQRISGAFSPYAPHGLPPLPAGVIAGPMPREWHPPQPRLGDFPPVPAGQPAPMDKDAATDLKKAAEDLRGAAAVIRGAAGAMPQNQGRAQPADLVH